MKKYYTRIRKQLITSTVFHPYVVYTAQYRVWWFPIYFDIGDCENEENVAKLRIDHFLKEKEYGVQYIKYPEED